MEIGKALLNGGLRDPWLSAQSIWEPPILVEVAGFYVDYPIIEIDEWMVAKLKGEIDGKNES